MVLFENWPINASRLCNSGSENGFGPGYESEHGELDEPVAKNAENFSV